VRGLLAIFMYLLSSYLRYGIKAVNMSWLQKKMHDSHMLYSWTRTNFRDLHDICYDFCGQKREE